MKKNFAIMYGLESINEDLEGNSTVVEPKPVESTITDTDGTVETTPAADPTAVTTTETPTVAPETETDNTEPNTTLTIPEPVEPPRADIEPKQPLVFLGGTCNESGWRDTLIEGLTIRYFNPVVQDWTADDAEKENQIKDSADFNLFVFTPKHTGYFSFVEAAASAIKSPSRTILCVLTEDAGSTFEEDKLRSLQSIIDTLSKEGIKVYDSLDSVREYLNQQSPVNESTGVIKQSDIADATSTELETKDATVDTGVPT